jgi:hypothetical protein
MAKRIVNDELKRMWKDVIVTYFQVININFLGKIKESQNSDDESHLQTPKYDEAVVSTQP